MTTAAEQITQDPAFKDVPPPPCACAGFVGFRTYDGAAVSYTRRILFRGRYVLLTQGAQVNLGGLRDGFDFWTRPTPESFFTRFSHGHTTPHEDARDLMHTARVYEAVNEADDQQQEALHLYLFRLGVRYERAKLREPRDHDTMDAIDAALTRLQGKFDEFNCGLMFMRGQNGLRKLRGLEEVAAW